jgi:hypothetical protein
MVVALKVASRPSGLGAEHLLAPGDVRTIGRSTSERPVDIAVSDHGDVPADLGIISAAEDHWLISNHTDQWLMIASVDEGGAFARIAPGRVEAPIPFEISRLIWPRQGEELVLLEAFSMDARFRDAATSETGETVVLSWKKDSKHFLVLTALCEPQLRAEDRSDVPNLDALVQRLRATTGYPEATRGSVKAQIEYLAVKCGKVPDDPDRTAFDNQKRQRIVRYAMRFGLVQGEDLRALDAEATICLVADADRTQSSSR